MRGDRRRRPGRAWRRVPWRGVACGALLLAAAACTRTPEARSLHGGVASNASPIALAPDGTSVWVVNPDADSITRIDTSTRKADAPIPVGEEPWAWA